MGYAGGGVGGKWGRVEGGCGSGGIKPIVTMSNKHWIMKTRYQCHSNTHSLLTICPP